MKKLITLLFCAVITFSAFSQKKVLYLKAATPPAGYGVSADSMIVKILKDAGYDVYDSAMTATSSKTGFDLVVIGETPGSNNAGMINYKDAPMPMVMLKVHAIKTNAASLSWITTADYNNTSEMKAIVVEPTHPILKRVAVVDGKFKTHTDSISSANCTYVSFPATTGLTVVTKLEPVTAGGLVEQHIVAIKENTVLNNNTLKNKVVILGYHGAGQRVLTKDAIQTIKNACEWAITGDVKDIVSVSDVTTAKVTAYPNPSNGMFNLQFSNQVDNVNVTVASIDGRIVYTKAFTKAQLLKLDLSNMQSGLYIVNYNGTGVNGSQRLFLNKK